MPRPQVLLKESDPITADFAFIRWEGHHKDIQKKDESVEQDNLRSNHGTGEVGQFLPEDPTARYKAVFLREQPLRRICARNG